MKKKIANIILGAALAASIALAAAAPGIVALVPLFVAVCAAIALIDINTDWIWTR